MRERDEEFGNAAWHVIVPPHFKGSHVLPPVSLHVRDYRLSPSTWPHPNHDVS